MKLSFIEKEYALVVVGGGLSGLCAAIAAARHGVRTALVQNRPMPGGNASSEIRMHACGAAGLFNARRDARETGIVEEIHLENRYRNPLHCFPVFDSVLWEKAKAEKNLDLFLNTHIYDVDAYNGHIASVSGVQLTTEKQFRFIAPLFIDATGDGFVAANAGAEIMHGIEARSACNEPMAPEEANDNTMGNSLLFVAKDMGHPVPFVAPGFARKFTEDDLAMRDHHDIRSGYWWVELGGERDTIGDFEEIRDELLPIVYGIWDHIKNVGDHGAENYALTWVQALPGKRESRRVRGEYLLNANDLMNAVHFEDTVAYGGWPIDVHPPRGITGSTEVDANHFYKLESVYEIPYRCLVPLHVDNLLVAGRAFSLTHAAFASARVMGTTSVVGQAAGTAAYLCDKYGLTPHGLTDARYISELQQTLLRDDCYLPNVAYRAEGDLALSAKLSATSGDPSALTDGYLRAVNGVDHAYEADASDAHPTVRLSLGQRVCVGQVVLKLDSDLNRDLMITIDEESVERVGSEMPGKLLKTFTVSLTDGGRTVGTKTVTDNRIRNVVLDFGAQSADGVEISLGETWGSEQKRLYAVSVFKA